MTRADAPFVVVDVEETPVPVVVPLLPPLPVVVVPFCTSVVSSPNIFIDAISTIAETISNEETTRCITHSKHHDSCLDHAHIGYSNC